MTEILRTKRRTYSREGWQFTHVTTPNRPYYATPEGRRALLRRKLQAMELGYPVVIDGVRVELKHRESSARAYWCIDSRPYYSVDGAIDALLRCLESEAA